MWKPVSGVSALSRGCAFASGGRGWPPGCPHGGRFRVLPGCRGSLCGLFGWGVGVQPVPARFEWGCGCCSLAVSGGVLFAGEPVALCPVAGSVREAAVVSVEWVAASAEGDEFVDFG